MRRATSRVSAALERLQKALAVEQGTDPRTSSAPLPTLRTLASGAIRIGLHTVDNVDAAGLLRHVLSSPLAKALQVRSMEGVGSNTSRGPIWRVALGASNRQVELRLPHTLEWSGGIMQARPRLLAGELSFETSDELSEREAELIAQCSTLAQQQLATDGAAPPAGGPLQMLDKLIAPLVDGTGEGQNAPARRSDGGRADADGNSSTSLTPGAQSGARSGSASSAKPAQMGGGVAALRELYLGGTIKLPGGQTAARVDQAQQWAEKGRSSATAAGGDAATRPSGSSEPPKPFYNPRAAAASAANAATFTPMGGGIAMGGGGSAGGGATSVNLLDQSTSAIDELLALGARVIQPIGRSEVDRSAGGAPETMATAAAAGLEWSSLAGADRVRAQVEESLLMPLRHPEAFAAVRAHTRACPGQASLTPIFPAICHTPCFPPLVTPHFAHVFSPSCPNFESSHRGRARSSSTDLLERARRRRRGSRRRRLGYRSSLLRSSG